MSEQCFLVRSQLIIRDGTKLPPFSQNVVHRQIAASQPSFSLLIVERISGMENPAIVEDHAIPWFHRMAKMEQLVVDKVGKAMQRVVHRPFPLGRKRRLEWWRIVDFHRFLRVRIQDDRRVLRVELVAVVDVLERDLPTKKLLMRLNAPLLEGVSDHEAVDEAGGAAGNFVFHAVKDLVSGRALHVAIRVYKS